MPETDQLTEITPDVKAPMSELLSKIFIMLLRPRAGSGFLPRSNLDWDQWSKSRSSYIHINETCAYADAVQIFSNI